MLLTCVLWNFSGFFFMLSSSFFSCSVNPLFRCLLCLLGSSMLNSSMLIPFTSSTLFPLSLYSFGIYTPFDSLIVYSQLINILKAYLKLRFLMSKKEISIGEFERLLPLVADKDTSADPNGWTKENPTWGHCAVASVVANKLFGGEILRASLEHVPEFARMRSHYVNSFQDKGIVDFTKPQFGENYPADLKFESRTRDYLIGKNASPQTRQRYKTLSFRLAKVVYENNPLFDDPIYKLCLDNAFESPCQKMGFGSIIVKDSEVIYKGDNDQAIEQLKEFCEPKCIRLDIQSRTDSTIGA